MPSYDKWRPSKDVSTLKGSYRVLSKETLKENDESYLDVPTFMRKNGYEVKVEQKEI